MSHKRSHDEDDEECLSVFKKQKHNDDEEYYADDESEDEERPTWRLNKLPSVFEIDKVTGLMSRKDRVIDRKDTITLSSDTEAEHNCTSTLILDRSQASTICWYLDKEENDEEDDDEYNNQFFSDENLAEHSCTSTLILTDVSICQL
jgi:hypothetical protein